MARRKTTITYSLSANEHLRIPIVGRVLIIKNVTGSVSLKVDDDGFDTVTRGLKVGSPDAPQFNHLELQETAGAVATITIFIGDGDVDDLSLILDQGVELLGAGTIAAAAVSVTTAATALAAASPDERNITIRNNGASTVYIGAIGVTVAQGFPLIANESIELCNKAAIYGIVASGTCDCRVLTEIFS